MAIFQQKLTSSAVDATTVTTTLDAVSTTGSMLVAILSVDKQASFVGTIPGFSTPVVVISASSVTLAYSYKISDGTEQSITQTWVPGSGRDGRLWVGEIKDPVGSAPSVVSTNDSGGASVTSLSTGTTSAFTGTGIAIAAWASDTGTNTDAGRSYTNSFIEQDYFLTASGGHNYSGLIVAAKDLSNVTATTLESTFSTTSGGDQMSGAMLVIEAAAQDYEDTIVADGLVITDSILDDQFQSANIEHYWSTAQVTDATVKCRVPSGLSTVLEYSTTSSFTASLFTSPVVPQAADDYIATFNLTGLTGQTQYYVRCVENGVTDAPAAKFKTTAASGTPASFEMVWSGDINSGVESQTMDNMVNRNSDLLFINGDMHYADIGTDSVTAYRNAFKGQFALPKFRNMMSSYSTAYIWDDHDYGANDSDASSPSKNAAATTFREYNPAPYLRNASGSVEHTFDYGRVRFIMLDNRHDRVSGNLLGTEQEAWLLSLLETTSNDSNIRLVVIHTGVPWQSSIGGNDTWYGSSALRTRVADKIWEVGLQERVIMMAGDAHMTTYADGSANTYDTHNRAGWPVYQSGGISRTGSVKGGPWTVTPTQSTVDGIYSTLNITDDGTDITVSNTAYGPDNLQTYTHSFVIPAEPAGPYGTIASSVITRGQSFDVDMNNYTAGASTEYVELWVKDVAGDQTEYPCVVTVNTNNLITATAPTSGTLPSALSGAEVIVRPIITLGT